jgi:hypothetical protein
MAIFQASDYPVLLKLYLVVHVKMRGMKIDMYTAKGQANVMTVDGADWANYYDCETRSAQPLAISESESVHLRSEYRLHPTRIRPPPVVVAAQHCPTHQVHVHDPRTH